MVAKIIDLPKFEDPGGNLSFIVDDIWITYKVCQNISALPKIKIFISSVQSEFANERRMLADYLQHDALFRKFCEAFIFEDIPAQDRTANDLYLDEVQKCDVYIGLFGKQFGFEFEDGTSPTEREYDCATVHNKYRLIFLSNANAKERNPKMNRLIEKASIELVYRTWYNIVSMQAYLRLNLK